MAVLVAVAGFLAACNSASESTPARILAVPSQYETIQAAVDDAATGDLVLIDPGTYDESVLVETAGITIRGADRNAVILDGGDVRPNGIVVTADGVAVENLTVTAYTQNGVFFNGFGSDPDVVYGTDGNALEGYRVSYVTTYNNGLYGIYIFAGRGGVIEHSYASGHPDSGIYIGQCQPCDAEVRNSIAERNAIGFYGTNASTGLYIIESIFRNNRLGIAPNSQDMELLAPQTEVIVASNLVADNDEADAPAIRYGFSGGGIVIGGGTSNRVVGNRVTGHDYYGIGIVDFNQYQASGNTIEGNELSDNATDLVFDPRSASGSVPSSGNCFADNRFTTSQPAAIETVLPCDGNDHDVDVVTSDPPRIADEPDYRTLPVPPDQPSMPDARTAPFGPVAATVPAIDLDSLAVPAA